jgi:AraC-like DNA-binding protein
MKISEINPYIRYARPSVLSERGNLAKRIIYDYEIIRIEKGSITLCYNGKTYECNAGATLLICPNVEHSFTVGKYGVSQPHIHFDITYKDNSERIPISFKSKDNMTSLELSWIDKNVFSKYGDNPILKVENKAKFDELFYRIISPDNKDDELTKKALLTQLIALVIKENFPDFYTDNRQELYIAKQIKEHIDAGSGLKMGLDDFAKFFSYSKFYLEKVFKKEEGESIISYRNKKRMTEAKKLLKTYSVSQVSEILGYQSLYAFSRAYKLFYGRSPNKDK